MQRLQLADVYLIDILWHAQGIAITFPVDTLEIVQQLLPRHDVDSSHGVTTFNLIQGLYADGMLDGPLGLHLFLSLFFAIAYHLEEILKQGLLGFNCLLLLLIRVSIVLLWQRGTAMTATNHILGRVEWIE